MNVEICQECDRDANDIGPNTFWYAPNDLWNEVNGSPNGFYCPPCFTRACAEKGIQIGWRAERPDRHHGDGVIACILAMNDVRHDRGQASMPYPSSHFFAAFLGALKTRGWEVRPLDQETNHATD